MIRRNGVKVLRVYREKRSGKSIDLKDRPQLVAALNHARRRRVPLVSAASSRFIRSSIYHAHKYPDEKPTVSEFQQFMQMARRVTLATLNDPDATCPDDESFLRQIVSNVTGNKIGRPLKKHPGWTKERKKTYLQLARQLRREGFSFSEIALEISFASGRRLTQSGVARWLKSAV
jgi:hypothetical protein